MRNFKEKLKFVKQFNNSRLLDASGHTLCAALFYPIFTEPVWIEIDCEATLNNIYFLCEHRLTQTTSNTIPPYIRQNSHCPETFTYIQSKCWIIAQHAAAGRNPSASELKHLDYYLSAWSLGHKWRTVVGTGYVGKLRQCFKTNAFLHQRLKTFTISNDCGQLKAKYNLLLRKPMIYRNVCNTNSHYACDQGTCILHTYICDGIYDCYDKSDEKNCTAILQRNECSYSMGRCEPDLSTYSVSDELFYKCASGEHVPLALRCDHHAHCEDNSDEDHCPPYVVTFKLDADYMAEVLCTVWLLMITERKLVLLL